MKPLPWPSPSTLRRCWEWKSLHATPPDLARVARHESGHCLVAGYFAMPGLRATASAHSGLTTYDFPPDIPEPGADVNGALTATAASIFHAGVMAEMLYLNIPWAGPVHYARHADFQHAEAMLKSKFGCCASGAHAFGQRVALAILSTNWTRVTEIATTLIATGTWTDGTAPEAFECADDALVLATP